MELVANQFSGLPSDHALITFRHMSQIQTAAQQALDQLIENEGGNQFLVVMGISEVARQQLDNDKECLGGITFRFLWEGSTGLLKVIPTLQHDVTARSMTGEIGFQLRAQMGIPREDIMFGNTTTHKALAGKTGKQPDDCFWPSSRQGRSNRAQGWPTLVIETGVSKSLSKLRADAQWWFHNSSGQTRFVLIVSISRRQRRVTVEKWQMQIPSPAFVLQPVASAAQEIVITPASVSGAPLTLDFEALFDRPPQGTEADIVLDANDLRHCARVV